MLIKNFGPKYWGGQGSHPQLWGDGGGDLPFSLPASLPLHNTFFDVTIANVESSKCIGLHTTTNTLVESSIKGEGSKF